MARIVRDRETANYTVLPNAALQDGRLSWRARGLLAFLLTLRPDEDIDSADLVGLATEGRDAVRTALREIERMGYLVRPRVRDAHGRWSTDWVVRSHPVLPSSSGSRSSVSSIPRPDDVTCDTGPSRLEWPVDDSDESVDNSAVSCG